MGILYANTSVNTEWIKVLKILQVIFSTSVERSTRGAETMCGSFQQSCISYIIMFLTVPIPVLYKHAINSYPTANTNTGHIINI